MASFPWTSTVDVPIYAILKLAVLSLCTVHAAAWGSSSSSSEVNSAVYGSALDRDWLYDGSALSLKLEGCVWGYVDDSENAGCMAQSSEDGTTYWYQMANCRRAQAVFSVYASSGNNAACNSGNFKESFVTTGGLGEFVYYLQTYDSNYDIGNYDYVADDGYNNGNNNGYNQENIPMCESAGNGYYIGVGCADDGTFSLQYFDDYYCMQPNGKTYNKMRNLNKALKNYKSCVSTGSNNDNGYNVVSKLVSSGTVDGCTSLDSNLCSDSSSMKSSRKSTSSHLYRSRGFGQSKSWLTKLKYVSGGLLCLASFIMFTGILFTNRRRRRALMQRKYRQSRKRGDSASRRSSSGRSKSRKSSRSRSKSKRSGSENEAGIFT